MCSSCVLNGVNQLKVHVGEILSASSTANNKLTRTRSDDLADWCATLALTTRLVSTIAILAIIVVVLYMIVKCISDFGEDGAEEGNRRTETNPLQSGKTVSFTYGTCTPDVESGNCETCCNTSSSSSEELFDAKLCVICYDEERNCFFVPCGHCATCYVCAHRIFSGENKVCPVCRRLVRKVRKLFAP